MHKFQDCLNRFWEINITFWTLKQLRKNAGVDLFHVTNLAGIGKVVEDPEKLVAALFVCCEDQIKTAGLTEDEFAKGFAGDALLEGADAFIQSWIDYQPDPAGRDLLREAVVKAREAQGEVFAIGRRAIENIKFHDIAGEVFDKQLSATELPATAE